VIKAAAGGNVWQRFRLDIRLPATASRATAATAGRMRGFDGTNYCHQLRSRSRAACRTAAPRARPTSSQEGADEADQARGEMPSVLLMDEPFGALDAQTRGLTQDLLLQIWEEESLTVMFVTHDVDEAVYLSERLYVLSARPGRVKEVVEIDLARPREYSVQLTPEFLELKHHVRDLIHREAVVNTGFAEVLSENEPGPGQPGDRQRSGSVH
jgi:hypothetical protein